MCSATTLFHSRIHFGSRWCEMANDDDDYMTMFMCIGMCVCGCTRRSERNKRRRRSNKIRLTTQILISIWWIFRIQQWILQTMMISRKTLWQSISLTTYTHMCGYNCKYFIGMLLCILCQRRKASVWLHWGAFWIVYVELSKCFISESNERKKKNVQVASANKQNE